MSPSPIKTIERLRQEHPAIPEDYLDFLREIGFGSIGEMGYRIYGGLIQPDEIYDAVSAEHLNGLLLFGDDFAGVNAAFNPQHHWQVVEIDSVDMSSRAVASSFEQFLRARVLPRAL